MAQPPISSTDWVAQEIYQFLKILCNPPNLRLLPSTLLCQHKSKLPSFLAFPLLSGVGPPFVGFTQCPEVTVSFSRCESLVHTVAFGTGLGPREFPEAASATISHSSRTQMPTGARPVREGTKWTGCDPAARSGGRGAGASPCQAHGCSLMGGQAQRCQISVSRQTAQLDPNCQEKSVISNLLNVGN